MLLRRQVDTVLHAILRLLPAIQSLFSWNCECCGSRGYCSFRNWRSILYKMKNKIWKEEKIWLEISIGQTSGIFQERDRMRSREVLWRKKQQIQQKFINAHKVCSLSYKFSSEKTLSSKRPSWVLLIYYIRSTGLYKYMCIKFSFPPPQTKFWSSIYFPSHFPIFQRIFLPKWSSIFFIENIEFTEMI